MRPGVIVCAAVGLVVGTVGAWAQGDGSPKPSTDRIAGLIRQLGADDFAKREAAARELEALGARTTAALSRATTSDDPEVRRRARGILDAINARLQVHCLQGHTDRVLAVALSPDRRFALSASEDGTVRLWDLATGKPVRSLARHRSRVRFALAFSPDGKRALTFGEDDRAARLWDVASGRELHRLGGHAGVAGAAAFAPDGKLAATADGTIHLWDTNTGKENRRFEVRSVADGYTFLISSIAFSRDCRRLLSCGHDGTVRLWDVATGKELRILKCQTKLCSVAFSPDGRLGLFGSKDRTLCLWDLKDGKALRRFQGHEAEARGVGFTPDGRRVVSVGYDRTVRMWDVATGKELFRILGHTDAITGAALSRCGRYVLSGSKDKTLRLWRLHGTE